jgi:hypothetical protein
LARGITADFYISGHTHETIYHGTDRFVYDSRDKMPRKRRRHFINNGSFLNYWDTYAQVKSYLPGTKGCAKLTFSGDKKEIEVAFK